MATQQKLSVPDGIEIQTKHLAEWKPLLRPVIFAALEAEVTKDNKTATTGYDICRGDSIGYMLQAVVSKKDIFPPGPLEELSVKPDTQLLILEAALDQMSEPDYRESFEHCIIMESGVPKKEASSRYEELLSILKAKYMEQTT